MKILVTGAKGFVGRNLCAELKNIRDGKARCYGDVVVEAVMEYDIDSTADELDRYCREGSTVRKIPMISSRVISGLPQRCLTR